MPQTFPIQKYNKCNKCPLPNTKINKNQKDRFNNEPLNSTYTKNAKFSALILNSKYSQGSTIHYANSGNNIFENTCLNGYNYNVKQTNLNNNPPPKNNF